MAKLKSNIIFNFLGSAWLGILTLAVTPIQVHFLGVEAFGFVGLITILQVLLGTLDLGISATVTKIVSADQSKGRETSADAVNTASSFYWAIAILIALLLFWNSQVVAEFWLSRTNLDSKTVALGIQIIAVYLGLRWPVAFYTGVISGLQRMDILNTIKAGVHTLRLIGGVVVLYFEPTLVAFLLWFAFSSAVELLVYAVVTYRILPILSMWPIFRISSFKDIWKYSVAMNFIALTALVLSQADRLVVTKFLSLEELGYYTIAYNASIVISLVQSAINSASFPAFSHSFSGGNKKELLVRYEKASQLMGLVVALPCSLLFFFCDDILAVWVNTQVAEKASSTMAWLALGFYFNAMVSNAYIAAIACGRPTLPLKVNLIAMLLYLPLLLWMAKNYGISGAAAAYAALNAYYLFSLLPMVQRGILNQGVWKWCWTNLIRFALIGSMVFGAQKLMAMNDPSELKTAVLIASGVIIYLGISWIFIATPLKDDILNMLKRAEIR